MNINYRYVNHFLSWNILGTRSVCHESNYNTKCFLCHLKLFSVWIITIGIIMIKLNIDQIKKYKFLDFPDYFIISILNV